MMILVLVLIGFAVYYLVTNNKTEENKNNNRKDPVEALKDLVSQYRTILSYLKWEDAGMVLAHGCGTRADIERTDFPQKAHRLGRAIAQ
jgi:hypothetical protein